MTDKDYNSTWTTHITILKAPKIDEFLERIYKDKMVPIKTDSFFKKRYLFNDKGDSTQHEKELDVFFKGNTKDIASLKSVELCFYSDYALLLSTFTIRNEPNDNFEKLKSETWSRNRNGDIPEGKTKAIESVVSFFLKQIAKDYTHSSNADNVPEIEIITPNNYVCEKSPLHADWKENEHLLCEQDSLGSSFMFVMASTKNLPQEVSPVLLNIEQIANCQCKKNFSDGNGRKQFKNHYTFSQSTGQSIVRFSSTDIEKKEYDNYLTLFTQTLIQKIDCYLRGNKLYENNTGKITREVEKEAKNLFKQTEELKRKIHRNCNTTAEGIVSVWLKSTDSEGLFEDISQFCLYVMTYNVKQRKEKTQAILTALTALTIISALNDSFSLVYTETYPKMAKTFGKLGIIISGLAFAGVLVVVYLFIKEALQHKKDKK